MAVEWTPNYVTLKFDDLVAEAELDAEHAIMKSGVLHADRAAVTNAALCKAVFAAVGAKIFELENELEDLRQRLGCGRAYHGKTPDYYR